MLDFILLLLGPIFLITGLYALFNVEKEALRSKSKLENRFEKKGKTKTSSLEKLKRQVRITGLWQVLLGLLLFVLMFSRVTMTIMEPNELVLAQGEEQTAENYDYEKILKQFLEQHSVPGLVAGIVNGQDSFLYVYSLEGLKTKRKVNETTIFEIGSISKAVTGPCSLKVFSKGIYHWKIQ